MTQPPPNRIPPSVLSKLGDDPEVVDYFILLTDGLYFLWDAFNNGRIVHKSYTVSTAPDASTNTGIQIYVSDDVGGATLAFSDGTNWRRVQDRAIIS